MGTLATIGLSVIGCAGLAVLGPFLMPKLYGSTYGASTALLLSLALSAAAVSAATFISWATLARGRAMRATLSVIGVSACLEVAWAVVVANSSIALAAGPLVSLAVGLLAVGLVVRILRRGQLPLDSGTGGSGGLLPLAGSGKEEREPLKRQPG